jgi:hypothetical protein
MKSREMSDFQKGFYLVKALTKNRIAKSVNKFNDSADMLKSIILKYANTFWDTFLVAISNH